MDLGVAKMNIKKHPYSCCSRHAPASWAPAGCPTWSRARTEAQRTPRACTNAETLDSSPERRPSANLCQSGVYTSYFQVTTNHNHFHKPQRLSFKLTDEEAHVQRGKSTHTKPHSRSSTRSDHAHALCMKGALSIRPRN